MFANILLASLLAASPVVPTCATARDPALKPPVPQAPDFEVGDVRVRERWARALVACLGDPDPTVRDGLAYSALSRWMRGALLEPTTLADLRADLLVELAAEDRRGFRAPFAALVLAEVARTDRVSPWMDASGRRELLDAAVVHFRGVSDFRGFRDGEGWRHGIAHGADWLMQLALNPAVDAAGLATILDALATQVAPDATMHYVHGESARMARAAHVAFRRGALTDDELRAWIAGLAEPAPLPTWSAAFESERGLARRHNVTSFLVALARLESGAAGGSAEIARAIEAALARVDGV
jgi:hypothetical protein